MLHALIFINYAFIPSCKWRNQPVVTFLAIIWYKYAHKSNNRYKIVVIQSPHAYIDSLGVNSVLVWQCYHTWCLLNYKPAHDSVFRKHFTLEYVLLKFNFKKFLNVAWERMLKNRLRMSRCNKGQVTTTTNEARHCCIANVLAWQAKKWSAIFPIWFPKHFPKNHAVEQILREQKINL